MNLYLLGVYFGLSQNIQLQKADAGSQAIFDLLHNFYLMKDFRPEYTLSDFAQDVASLSKAMEDAKKGAK
jgi:hypothetical protein